MYPFESIAIDVSLDIPQVVYEPTEPTSMIREGIGPPELVGIALGDITLLFVKLNEL